MRSIVRTIAKEHGDSHPMTRLTIPEAAERWRCSTKTVRHILAAGLVTHIRLSRNRVLIPMEAVEEYEQRKTVQARKVTR